MFSARYAAQSPRKTLSLVGTAIALALPAMLHAQEPAAASEDDDAVVETPAAATPVLTEEAAASNDLIVVTGTRINRAENEQPYPLVSYSAEDIALSGETDLADILAQSPALINSTTDFDAAGDQASFRYSGLNLLILRNLGADRTLVLVNGRRHVGSASGTSSVDINSIPNALVERVDILTGGVSAIYGADGVSGVVNFVMKRDYEGVDARLQQGISDEGDGRSRLFSLTLGDNFGGDRGNIALSYQYRSQQRLSVSDRPAGEAGALRFARNPDDFPDDPNIYDNILVGDQRFLDSSPGGAVFIDPSFVPIFQGNGDLYDRGSFDPYGYPYILGGTNTDTVVGGSSTPVASYGGDLQPDKEAHIVNFMASFEVSPALRLFAEGKYARSETYTEGQPTFGTALIYAAKGAFGPFVIGNNPFIPDSIRAAVAPGNFSPFTGVFVSRDNFDFGRLTEKADRDLYRGVFGAEGELADGLRYEVSYTYGRSDATITNENYRIEDRYYAALNAVDEGEYLTGSPNGNIVCLADLEPGSLIDPYNYGLPAQTFTPGDGSCVPLNIFGEGAPSQAALDWVLADLKNESRLEQHVINAYVSGEAVQLPAGPVKFALGAEYREEKSRFQPDPLAKQAVSGDPTESVLIDLDLIDDEKGRYDVLEAFGEVSVPLLADRPFAHLLELEGAIRLSDYSTVGTTASWKLGGLYAPVPDVALRGSWSRAVRAPNISELFAPQLGTFRSIADPCDISAQDDGTATRPDNCAAILNALGIDPTTYDASGAAASVAGISRGNSNLKEEEARTWTLGLLVQPRFVPGLTFTADWYDIRIEDAINIASPQQVANQCVDQNGVDNAFCGNIARDASTGYITGFVLQPLNVGAIETAGLDMTISYGFSPDGDWGDFNLRGTVGYLDKLLFQPVPGAANENRRGVLGAPKWAATGDITWRLGSLIVNYGLNYKGEQLYFTHEELKANPDIADPDLYTVDDVLTHDLRFEWLVNDKMSFYLGANNFTDEKPQAALLSEPAGYLGRYFYAGARFGLDDLGL